MRSNSLSNNLPKHSSADATSNDKNFNLSTDKSGSVGGSDHRNTARSLYDEHNQGANIPSIPSIPKLKNLSDLPRDIDQVTVPQRRSGHDVQAQQPVHQGYPEVVSSSED